MRGGGGISGFKLSSLHAYEYAPIAGMVILTAFLAWIADALSPYGWSNGSHEPDENNLLTLPNAIWDGILAIFGKDTMELKAWSTKWIVMGM